MASTEYRLLGYDKVWSAQKTVILVVICNNLKYCALHVRQFNPQK
jgi:hypothetical protein